MVHKSDYSNEAAAPVQVSDLDVLEQLQFSWEDDHSQKKSQLLCAHLT